jgi:transcription initiation factor TFIIE subunit alpha
MRLTKKLLGYVIQNVAGSEAIPIVKYIKGKENISEFEIAEKLEMDIKIVRILLYRLFNQNLVSSIRKKDKKKGWYIYYWTLNKDEIKHLFKNIQKEKRKRLKDRLEREKNTIFYVCENKCIRLNFEQAVNFDFKCPECGCLMEQEDNQEKIKKMQKEIELLEV